MRKSLALTVVLAATLLAGCTQTVALKSAENAIDPGCAEIIAHAPDEVGGFTKRETDAQGTLAWGDPSALILRCGVPEPDPTSTLRCVPVGGVDWLRDDADDPIYVFTTYGRSPATEVIVDSTTASAASALDDLSGAVSLTERVRGCVDVEDAIGTPTPTPTP